MEDKIKNLRKNLNEKDLIKQQNEFFKESKDPNFEPTISKLYKSKNVIKEEGNKLKLDETSKITNVFMPLNIIEHDTSKVNVNEIERSIIESARLDDKLIKNDLANLNNFKSTANVKKKSLFSQFMDSKKQKLNCLSNQLNVKSQLDQSEHLVTGTGLCENNKQLAKKEVELISEENDKLLKNLNDNEKKKLIDEYTKGLDPNLIEFIKSKKRIKKQNDEDKMAKDYVNFEIQTTSNQESPYVKLEDVKRNRWLNMDRIEKEKLEWMKPLIEHEAKKQVETKQNLIEDKAARFSFDGDLILKEHLDYRLGLHHHSEQDTAAGYTINELINLTQSKHIPQRVLALSTLANLFKRMHRGYFDVCFNKSITIELIEQTEICILLRSLLDDKSVSLQLVTIKCIHSLICNTIYDEFCLDRLFCSMELGIEIPKLSYTELSNENEYKDEQLCKLDVISCLVRTNILARLRYLLDNLILAQAGSIDSIVIDHIFDILIRICRHSAKACAQLVETPFLIECLINNFISPSAVAFNWKALKIIRILFTTDKQHLFKIRNKHPILFNTLRNYLITNPLNEQDCKEIYLTVIEVLRVWRVLLILDESNDTTEQFIELAQNLRNCLHIKILINNSFDLHYISNLLHCLAYVIQRSPALEHFFTSLIQDLTFQWFKEIADFNELPKLDGCLAISSALLYLNWSSTAKEQLFDYILKPILKSDLLFNKITQKLISNSSILNFKEYSNAIYRDSKGTILINNLILIRNL